MNCLFQGTKSVNVPVNVPESEIFNSNANLGYIGEFRVYWGALQGSNNFWTKSCFLAHCGEVAKYIDLNVLIVSKTRPENQSRTSAYKSSIAPNQNKISVAI